VTAFLTDAARVFQLAWRQMLWSRRTFFVIAIIGVPIVLALAARSGAVSGSLSMTVNGEEVGEGLFASILWVLLLRFVVPILGVWYGTSLIADEVEEKTITYLFVRPIRRGAVVVGKYLAYLACTAAVVLPGVVVVHAAGMSEAVDGSAGLLRGLAALTLGLASYGALFAFTGTSLRRPLVAGLVFAFGWEPLAMLVPGYLRRFTLAYYLEAVFRDTLAAAVGVGFLLAVTVVCLLLATHTIERREFILEQ
jgi:ABC-type transport system involved in multi-copper enzyme maturation permease subunit